MPEQCANLFVHWLRTTHKLYSKRNTKVSGRGDSDDDEGDILGASLRRVQFEAGRHTFLALEPAPLACSWTSSPSDVREDNPKLLPTLDSKLLQDAVDVFIFIFHWFSVKSNER